MYNNNYTPYENINYASKPYRALNMIVQKSEVPADIAPPTQEESNQDETLNETNVGYITVRVYTALGALPVPEAVVTVYTKVNDEENAYIHLASDSSGNVPNIELPIAYDPSFPPELQKYNFATYNMRIQALGYYTVNVLDLRIFPGISTDYKVDMIPVIAGTEGRVPEQTIIIPPPPIESTI